MSFQSVSELAIRLHAPGRLTQRDLHTAWEQRLPVPDPATAKSKDAPQSAKQIPWLQDNLDVAVDFTARALESDELLLVCDCAREALRLWGAEPVPPVYRVPLIQLRMHHATALARLGHTAQARRQLEPCVSTDFHPPLDAALQADILLQLGHILREESVCAPLRAAREHLAGQALEFYQRALRVQPDRLEARALTAAAGFVISRPGSEVRAQAQEHARQVLARTQTLKASDNALYHLTYCRGVAQAVLGTPEEAFATFQSLADVPGATTSNLADARYWARTLAKALDLDHDFFRPAFPPLQLIVFSGHLPDRLDRPDRPSRLPFHAVGEVGAALDTALAEARASVGMVSAAAGADLLFIEALRRQPGAAFHVVLPWEEEEFHRTSVAPFEPEGQPPHWEPKFRDALAHAATVRVIGQMYRPRDPAALVYTMEVTAGLALHTARAMRLDIQPMVLWDGARGHVAGGTDSFVRLWEQLGYTTTVLRPPKPTTEVRSAAHSPIPGAIVPIKATTDRDAERCERGMLRQEVKTMLFADIVGYSKLNENAIPQFVGVFLEALSQLTAASAHAPRYVNTWGDALCAVFDFAQDAGCFGMELIQLIRDRQEEWIKEGLGSVDAPVADGSVGETHPLDIRVGLHTGPVFLHYNPMVRQLAFTGVHVNRAARIEPVTPHGEVFASEEFTALAELDRALRLRQPPTPSGGRTGEALNFTCEYAGSMALAKNYPGRHRLYRVAPHRVFALEELAKVIHEDYCAVEARKGHTVVTNPSMRPWAELPEYLRDSNRAQAADIPNKLEALGYELAPSFGLPASAIRISDEQAAVLSDQEHERWMTEKRRGGWKFGPVRDDERKLHPSMIPWEELSAEEKDKDRAAVQNVPKLVEKAGFRVRKIIRAA